MNYLVDTNVLLRFFDRSHPLHPVIRSTIRELYQNQNQLQVFPQNCVEFWNVATRPVERNGFGFTPVAANRLLNLVERLFPLIPDSPAIYPEWRRLVTTFQVSGVQVHDARLVAAMRVHEIEHILTLNMTDFARYAVEGIVAINPALPRSE
ncbi:MAG: type II toxin-antitoxin system VapC family toxin [Leptolyngbyaceae cyanobacterium bins.302]|nr:type II toxin-antitoxin system VapC family toxin [Leptolyngbyaceae cyanobacterium bins.302]